MHRSFKTVEFVNAIVILYIILVLVQICRSYELIWVFIYKQGGEISSKVDVFFFCLFVQMWATVRWSWAWCPTGCRTVWTRSRTSGRTRGTELLQVLSWSLFSISAVYVAVNKPSCIHPPTVSYLNYGPFTSYAPTFDSSFANISKENSDLIFSLYGEESSLQGSDRWASWQICCKCYRSAAQSHTSKEGHANTDY